MFKGYIYRHWIINDKGIEKSYIGQTIQEPQKRWGKDGKGYKPQKNNDTTKFWNAIKKYGWSNFTHEIVQVIEYNDLDNLSNKLNELEREYIKAYNSYYNGYNSTTGGDGVLVTPALSTSKTIINVIEKNINNDKQKMKNIERKISKFNKDDKQYFIELMASYFSENKDVKKYIKRLDEKFNIQLNIEDFVYDIFFKQFSFDIYGGTWNIHTHFGRRSKERTYCYQLLFIDREWGRLATITCGQLCRLHSTSYDNLIYSKNTFWSSNIKTVWHDDILTIQESEELVYRNHELKTIRRNWDGRGKIANRIIKRNEDDTFLVSYIDFNDEPVNKYMRKEEYEEFFGIEFIFNDYEY